MELGADVVTYSITKYMNGHSDIVMGAAITRNDELEERLRFIQNGMTHFIAILLYKISSFVLFKLKIFVF